MTMDKKVGTITKLKLIVEKKLEESFNDKK